MSTSSAHRTIDSPLGPLLLVGREDSLQALLYADSAAAGRARQSCPEDPAALELAAEQLAQYFAGERRDFELTLAPLGTPFQRDVWQALSAIPYGQTRSYGEIAGAVGRPRAARAVGSANNKNPLAVIVPCHRVVGAGGAMVGYAGGLDRKTWLIEHERRHLTDADLAA